MSIDKLSSNAAITSAPERSPRSAVINGEQKATSSKAAAAQISVSTADVVRISVTAKGMLQAVKSSADDEEFDQARVDSIRREIAKDLCAPSVLDLAQCNLKGVQPLTS